MNNNSKVYYCLAVCQEHGTIEGKIRIRRTEEDKYFAVKTLYRVGTEEAEKIREKRDSLRLKRQLKRKQEVLKALFFILYTPSYQLTIIIIAAV